MSKLSDKAKKQLEGSAELCLDWADNMEEAVDSIDAFLDSFEENEGEKFITMEMVKDIRAARRTLDKCQETFVYTAKQCERMIENPDSTVEEMLDDIIDTLINGSDEESDLLEKELKKLGLV